MMASLGQGGADELVDYEEDEQQGVEGKDKGVVGGSTTVEDSVVGRGNYVAIHASGFRDFFLKPELVRAIGDAGFEHPSEVQHETIPHAITGADILCQAKSGMGKTAVFVLSILQQINIDSFGGGSGGLGGSGMGGGGASSGATGGGCVDGTVGVQSVVGGNSLGDNKNVANSKDGVGGGISGQKSGGRGGTAVNGIGVAGGGGGAGSGTVNGTLVGGSNSGGGVSGSIIMGTGLGGVGSGSNNSVSVDSSGAGLGSSGVAGGVVGGGVGVGSNSSSAVGGILCLAIAHTRELAYQIKNEFERFSKYLKGVRCEVVYGGIPMSKNIQMLKDPKTCPHILIGTPGRVLALVQRKAINVSHIAHFVLDECDKCLEKTDMRRDVQDIFLSTGKKKQVMFFSATMNRDIRTLCRKFMQHPIEVFIDDESKLTLHGLLQYYIKLQESEKNRRLNDLLDLLEFNQVIIFVKSVSRAQALDALLTECNFPSFAIHAGLGQEERINRYQQFKNFEKRIMVATDLFGRGIDIERVNIVINYDMPDSSDAYLHRVGRAGRFGTKGLAITFVASQEDTTALNDVQTRFEVHIPEMPATIDASQYINQ